MPKKKLEMVPQTQSAAAVTMISTLTAAAIPDNVEKLNLPPLVKPGDVPINTTISGKLVKLVENFTGKTTLRGSKVLFMKNGEIEFLFPLTGTVKRAMAEHVTKDGDELLETVVGRTLFLTRRPDGTSKNYGNKPMFMFDISLSKK